MRSRIILIVTLVLSLYSTVSSFGQTVSGSDGPPTPDGGGMTNAPGLPIDDHILILLAIGLILGLYFLIKKHRATDSPA